LVRPPVKLEKPQQHFGIFHVLALAQDVYSLLQVKFILTPSDNARKFELDTSKKTRTSGPRSATRGQLIGQQ